MTNMTGNYIYICHTLQGNKPLMYYPLNALVMQFSWQLLVMSNE